MGKACSCSAFLVVAISVTYDSTIYMQAELVDARDKVPELLAVPIPEDKPKGALGTVLERSRQICMKQYVKPLFTELGHLELLGSLRERPLLTHRQEAVFAGKEFPLASLSARQLTLIFEPYTGSLERIATFACTTACASTEIWRSIGCCMCARQRVSIY